MKTGKFVITEDLIGKYLNRCLWSDVDPIGKIIGIKGKSKVIVQPIVAGKNKVKMEWVSGGFAGHCVNQGQQEYDFTESGDVFEISLSNASMKNKYIRIHDRPIKYYDYNF
jgi:hypothetical protein